ncbi:MAG: pseudouridine-5'-phosphate glycosidase [Oligoflexia bacterium]|nr:pseudouridine-5'-phosphate glycosidase [Oligoflexia bacterium]
MFTPIGKNFLPFCSSEVASSIAEARPVVALESTIIAHGMPYPQNLEMALSVEKIVREQGCTPATVGIIQGKIKIGMTHPELQWLAEQNGVWKVNTRDIPYVVHAGATGATTVSATIFCAEAVGISVMVTGGIGGVHRGVEHSWDISTDLAELAARKVAVVCAGVKSILDIPKTLEYLETAGIPVITVGSKHFPAFYLRESGVVTNTWLRGAEEIAGFLKCTWSLSSSGGVLVANPIPSEHAGNEKVIAAAIEQALQECQEKGIEGKSVTPFLLERMCILSGGDSLRANIELVKNNALLGARVAKFLCQNSDKDLS